MRYSFCLFVFLLCVFLGFKQITAPFQEPEKLADLEFILPNNAHVYHAFESSANNYFIVGEDYNFPTGASKSVFLLKLGPGSVPRKQKLFKSDHSNKYMGMIDYVATKDTLYIVATERIERNIRYRLFLYKISLPDLRITNQIILDDYLANRTFNSKLFHFEDGLTLLSPDRMDNVVREIQFTNDLQITKPFTTIYEADRPVRLYGKVTTEEKGITFYSSAEGILEAWVKKGRSLERYILDSSDIKQPIRSVHAYVDDTIIHVFYAKPNQTYNRRLRGLTSDIYYLQADSNTFELLKAPQIISPDFSNSDFSLTHNLYACQLSKTKFLLSSKLIERFNVENLYNDSLFENNFSGIAGYSFELHDGQLSTTYVPNFPGDCVLATSDDLYIKSADSLHQIDKDIALKGSLLRNQSDLLHASKNIKETNYIYNNHLFFHWMDMLNQPHSLAKSSLDNNLYYLNSHTNFSVPSFFQFFTETNNFTLLAELNACGSTHKINISEKSIRLKEEEFPFPEDKVVTAKQKINISFAQRYNDLAVVVNETPYNIQLALPCSTVSGSISRTDNLALSRWLTKNETTTFTIRDIQSYSDFYE